MSDVVELQREQTTDLILRKDRVLLPEKVFAPGGVAAILDKITTEVRSIKTDVSTHAGREAIKSLAYKVARSKTALDAMGKELGETHYKAWKAITAERGIIEKTLDELRDEVRKPVTDWENAEETRVADHQGALAIIEKLAAFPSLEPSAAEIEARIAAFIALPHREWQEFTDRATETRSAVREKLTAMLDVATKREAERAELERARKETAEREQKERDERIAAEAAERARKDAEERAAAQAKAEAAKAAAEKARVEREKADAIARAEAAEAARKAAIEKAERDKKAAADKVERERKAAAEKAERDRVAAVEAERKRISDEQAKQAAEAAKREANTRHVAAINKAITAALVEACPGLDERNAMAVVAAIARGDVPHVKINY